MKYDLDRNASAELTRLVLQKMSAQEARFTPTCFTVWYEFLSGANLRLSHAMHLLLDGDLPINDQAIQYLYDQHVSEFNVEAQQVIRDTAHRILSEIKIQTDKADHKASEYSGHLARSVGLMTEQLPTPALQAVVGELRQETDTMQAAVRDLSQNLAKSQSEIDELRQQLDLARAEALSDPLTGLLNRRGFQISLTDALDASKIQATPVTMIMIDIDHFKKVNDTYGHVFGDKVIRALAEVLKLHVKNEGTVARLGGEEFGILMTKKSLEEAQALAERIRLAMEHGKIRRIEKNDQIDGITVSSGVAKLLEDEEHVAFIDRADKALYQAKELGRNRVSLAIH